MKKLVLIMTLLACGSIFAKSHGPSGCGLGAILFPDKEGTFWNVLAATFNGTSGNQTFGMSTGTLGCEDAATSKVAAVSFVEANQVALANDIAKGQGQTLTAYLHIVGKKNSSTQILQDNFETIFSGTTPAQINQNILNLI